MALWWRYGRQGLPDISAVFFADIYFDPPPRKSGGAGIFLAHPHTPEPPPPLKQKGNNRHTMKKILADALIKLCALGLGRAFD